MPFKVGSCEVIQTLLPPCEKDPGYDNPDPSTTILRKGHKKFPDCAAFQVDTIFEKDVKITLRDGTKIRADIFRPANTSEKVPALVAWSPYGKSGRGFFQLDLAPGRVGVPIDRLSRYEKFEAPDPAEWTARGYAIINPDIRGSWDSEGELHWWCSQEGRDGYDVTEELAKSSWCNGSVAFVGNSWLGIAQWFIAAERPPHLKCIAPFEGASDIYREIICRGGVPSKAFLKFLAEQHFGRGSQEHLVSMIEKYPSMNEYWADKRAKISQINVPIYATASYSTALHTYGSFRGFTEAPVKQKWLRVHSTQEWHDLYQRETNDELQRFLDCYTKRIDNEWESTPKVRVSIYQYNKEPIINRVFPDWPIPSTKFETLYLRIDRSISVTPENTISTLSYRSDVPFQQMDADQEELTFEYVFQEPACLVGSARVKLYMSCRDHDDMDIWVMLRKADHHGMLMQQLTIPQKDSGLKDEDVPRINPVCYLGPSGALRASYRKIDAEASTTSFPEHNYVDKRLVPPGTVVELEIGLWQTGISFEAGERLLFKVSGHNMTLAEFPMLRGQESNENLGVHNLHLGGSTPSSITIPLVSI